MKQRRGESKDRRLEGSQLRGVLEIQGQRQETQITAVKLRNERKGRK